jgi:uncharacterized membrane protein YfcA
MDFASIILIIVIASLIKGITGFGFALVAMPPLLFWYSPRELVPALMICNLMMSLMIVLQKKEHHLVPAPFKLMIVAGAIFTVTGVMVLALVPERPLIIGIASIFLILLLLSLWGSKLTIKANRISCLLNGALCGFLEGSISVSGPPMVLFLNHAKVSNQQFREIFSWFCLITAIIAVGGYASSGLLNTRTLAMGLMVLPVLYAGSYFGKRINAKLPPKLFRRMSLILTIISCIIILIRAWQ